MRIDCEAYYLTKPLAGLPAGLAELEAMSRASAIDRVIIMPETSVQPNNRQLAEALAALPLASRQMFSGCAWVNPHFDTAVKELEQAVKEWGFVALKLMATHHAFRFVTTAAHALMRKAAELGIPVTIHSGESGFSHPLEIAELATAFPSVPIILDHMGYRYQVPEALAAARRVPNIYLATTAVMEPHFIRLAVQEIGAERVIFGTNAPFVHSSTQLMVIKQAELGESDEKKIVSENSLRLFQLDKT